MNNPVKHDANVRLCRAVQKHPCLYDRSDENYDKRDAYDFAWDEIAGDCLDTATSCKQRWRVIRRSFKRSLGGTPRNRKAHRTQKYYLHDVLEFFMPHINGGPEAEQVRESDDETESVKRRRSSTMSDIKTKADENLKADEFIEERKIDEHDKKIKSEEHTKKNEGKKNSDRIDEVIGEKNEETPAEKDTKSNKKSLPSRRKTLYKEREELKVEEYKVDEPRSNRRSQASKAKVEEKIDTEEEKEQKTFETKPNKKSQAAKKVDTFYISPKDSDSGTFVIRKNNANRKIEDAAQTNEEVATHDDKDEAIATVESRDDSKEDSKVGEADEADETEESPTAQQNDSRFRFKRACKRGLDKSMINQLRLRQREPDLKRIRHSTERLRSIAKATLELAESIRTPNKGINPKEMLSKNISDLRALQAEATEMEVEPSPITALVSTKQALPTAAASVSPPLTNQSIGIRAITFESQAAETSLARMHQSVQCNLQPTSTDEDFLCTLKPYLNDMNARQKLHFKKKIFESLMEVFDSGANFPADASKSNAAAAPPAIIPAQLLKKVGNEELRLVRELVAMVQAAKQTPELNLNTNSPTDSVTELVSEKRPTISPSVSVAVSVPPPPLTLRSVSAINASVQSITSPVGLRLPVQSRQVSISSSSPSFTLSTSMANTLAPTAASTPVTTSTAASSPMLVQRRIIRKLVKVNELGQPTYELSAPSPVKTSPPPVADGLRRRILRIFPKSSLSNGSLENAVTSSGVGTFVVPRLSNATANIGHQSIKVVSTAATSTTVSASSINTQNMRQFVTPVSTIGWTTVTIGSSTTTANSLTASGIANRAVGVSGARPIVRRYSVCGALPNVTVERHTASNYLTTTANTKPVSSTTQSTTAAARDSPLSFNLKDIFKLPAAMRSTTTPTTTQGTTIVTKTTSSRTMPVLSVSASDGSTSARTMPLTMGFNKFVRNDGAAIGSADARPRPKQIIYHKTNMGICQSTISLNNNSSNFNAPTSPSKHSAQLSAGVKRLLEDSSNSSEKRICANGEKGSNGEATSAEMAGVIDSDDFTAVTVKSEPIEDY
ncbi:mucin-17-like [Rhagoletis pomonella]|uniref:mucin-17-like n=1 Tax=Rhagoletis pomonella TaxID=28610 RepID=UPI00177AE522|nr:mucin-17-like [Rhagoletis pomonella]